MITEHTIDWRKTAQEIQDDFEAVCKQRDELALIIATDTGSERVGAREMSDAMTNMRNNKKLRDTIERLEREREIDEQRVADLMTQVGDLAKQNVILREALEDAVSVAKTAHEHWDNDQDSKAGKYLIALAGGLRGYDGRTDAVHKAIARAREQK